MAGGDQEIAGAQSEPTASSQQAWARDEEAKLEQIEQTTEADEQQEEGVTARPDRWRPFRREAHNEAAQQVQFDQMEVGFEKEIESEIASGQIAVPEGGPLTPEEIHEAEMNPWPGHSMEETVARMRSERAGRTGAGGEVAATSG
jgi:hypothetical protein